MAISVISLLATYLILVNAAQEPESIIDFARCLYLYWGLKFLTRAQFSYTIEGLLNENFTATGIKVCSEQNFEAGTVFNAVYACVLADYLE